VPLDKAATLHAGLPVQIQTRTNESLAGVVLAVEKALTLGESEVIIGLTNATDKLKPGEFLVAVITLPREESVTAIPRSALLRTSQGTFVYAVNGDAYFRTAVTAGTEADGLVEITDGLLTGDQVVTKPVETLWLIELRATKGGGHSH
jgi:multidrug efflux pump subunit AcrA (membrane-fusion protein)